jgi:hypothetical protein
VKKGSGEHSERPITSGERAHRPAGSARSARARGRAGSEARTKAAGKSASRSGRPRRPGRPRGSVSLTSVIQETIISYIRAGALPHVAAKAAGVNPGTFREWMARGESRHPTRPATPKLRRFAKAVNQAVAQTRVLAESRVYRDHPDRWLKTGGRTSGDLQGWNDSERDRDGSSTELSLRAISRFSDEEMHHQARRLDRAQVEAGSFGAPPCSDPACPCEFHEVWNAPWEPKRNEDDPFSRARH